MMSLATIRQMNNERAAEAAAAGLQPYVPTQEEIDGWHVRPRFPFPSIGSHEPEGWTLVDTHFVDSTGLGADDEPALTAAQFAAKLRDDRGYAVVSVGQFQVHVGEFERTERSFGNE